MEVAALTDTFSPFSTYLNTPDAHWLGNCTYLSSSSPQNGQRTLIYDYVFLGFVWLYFKLAFKNRFASARTYNQLGAPLAERFGEGGLFRKGQCHYLDHNTSRRNGTLCGWLPGT